MFTIIIIFGLILYGLAVLLSYLTKSRIKIIDSFLMVVLIASSLFFWNGLASYHQDYFEQVDSFSTNYTPFANDHIATLYTFLALSFIALVVLWIKQRALPPLLLVILLSMILIGAVVNIAIVIQVIKKTAYLVGDNDEDAFTFYFLPFTYLAITAYLLVRLLTAEAKLAVGRVYKSALLNRLNALMAKAQWLWVLFLAFPLFFVVMLILVLFGQDPHAITKVFTETTTWHFSTESHPPLLDHTGHYLCTVAACGDPALVKPIGWGYRHGYPIPVNRQLQIANAFEELIQERSPGLHRIIRKIYDQYGYPLSKKINNPSRSNITYRLMKPLEYFFLATLYFFCIHPEQKIAKQYL